MRPGKQRVRGCVGGGRSVGEENVCIAWWCFEGMWGGLFVYVQGGTPLIVFCVWPW